MLKTKIVELCQKRKLPIKKLALEIGVSEQSLYRWFNEDSMELKHLKKISEYFNVDITYFISNSETKFISSYEESPASSNKVNEKVTEYGVQDKYIKALERITELQEEYKILKEKLTWYELNCDCCKTKQDGQKRA